MPTYYEIPLSGTPQVFNIALPMSGSALNTAYRLLFQYRNAPMGGWFMDIMDSNANPIICGIPLVPGVDLLAQYAYLNLGGAMLVYSDGVLEAPPTFDNLGSGGHVIWATLP